jgi:hypothetical protein
MQKYDIVELTGVANPVFFAI